MGKKLRNKVIAVAVAATMTIPEVTSVGAEILQDLSEVQENISEQTDDVELENSEFENVQNDFEESFENEEVSPFSEDISEDDSEVAIFNDFLDMARAGENGIVGTLVLDYSDSGNNSEYYDFIIRGGKVNVSADPDFDMKSDDFDILYEDESGNLSSSDKWEVTKVSVDGYDVDGYLFTVKGRVKKNTEKGIKYTIKNTALNVSATFEYEPEVFGLSANNFQYKKTIEGYFDYFDDKTVSKSVKLAIPAVYANKLALYDQSKIELLTKAEYSDKNIINFDTKGFKGISIERIPNDDSKVNIVIEVTKEFESGAFFLSYNEKIVKTEDEKNILSIKYNKNICALAEKIDEEASEGKTEKVYQKGTKIEKGVLIYNGNAEQLVIDSVYNKQTITGVKIEGPNVKSVILPGTVKNLDSGSFGSPIESVVLSDTVVKVAADAFDTSISKIYYNGDKEIFDSGIQNKVVSYAVSLEEGKDKELDIETLSGKLCDLKVMSATLDDGSSVDVSDYNDVKWIVQSVDGKSSKNVVIDGEADDSKNIIGKKVNVTKTKANGMYNNQVIIKALSKDTDKVYAVAEFYITPKQTTDIITKISGDIEIPVGTTYKLDTKAVDGVNKNLIYESDSNAFTVVNGNIVGVKSGTGKVTVKSESNPAVSKVFNIVVTEPDVKLTTDVKSLSLVYNEPRTFVVNTGVSGDKTVNFDFDSGLYEISYERAGEVKSVTAGSGVVVDTTEKFKVKVKDGASMIKADKIQLSSDDSKAVISLNPATTEQNVIQLNDSVKKLTDGVAVINVPVGTSYNIGVSVLPVTADQSLVYSMSKGIKTEDTGLVLDDEDAAYETLKSSIFTADAVGSYYVQATSVGKDVNGKQLKSNIYKINAYEAGGTIEWKDKDYVVQGGFFMKKNDAETTCTKMVAGGQIIEIDAPETAGYKEEIIWTSSNPGCLSVAKKIEGTDEKLELGLVAAGTYTITGTTKYTNQKYSFKVSVSETEDVSSDLSVLQVYKKESNEWISDKKIVTDQFGKESVEDGDPVELSVGTETTVRLLTPVCSSKIVYKPLNPKLVSCDAKGVIKVLSADETATITATMTMKSGIQKSWKLVIKPIDNSEPVVPAIKVQLQESIQDNSVTTGIKTIDDNGKIVKSLDAGTLNVIAGGKLKEVPGVKYSYYENKLDPAKGSIVKDADGKESKVPDDKNITDHEISATDGLTVDGLKNDEEIKRFTLSADYEYQYESKDLIKNIFMKRFTVYQVLATKVSIHPEDAARVKRLGTAGSGLKAGNGTPGQSVVIDFLAEGTVAVTEDGKIVNKKVCATADDIEWTSSNTFLADIKTIDHKLGTGNDTMEDHFKGCKADIKTPYAKSLLITANDKNYKGAVTFTGTFKNSGKKVTFKILVE